MASAALASIDRDQTKSSPSDTDWSWSECISAGNCAGATPALLFSLTRAEASLRP